MQKREKMRRTYSHITTLSELVAERHRMKITYQQQEEVLKEHAQGYIRQFSPVNLFKKYFNKESFSRFDDKVNFSGKIMSIVLPLLLNKTVFRNSGFITRAVVGLVSNKLGGKLDIDHLGGIVDAVKGWFSKKKPKREVDYGIPPDSETY